MYLLTLSTKHVF